MNACDFCGANRPRDDGTCSNCGKPLPAPKIRHWTRQAILADPVGFRLQQLHFERRFEHAASA